ncbi:MAG TPA: YitT family protein [Ottowia sp.]|uniref:YitT family protein n=1 Tax=Ottowia sp. TaxID=1898956 RepID=UPI002C244FA8|nr:YitT family protein [Ottowia sp.]HNR82352.1 YitT family protein [Ottowia sp.]HNT83961.1 YitT family protein [Ottowia sp.]HOZ93492.1 YitT family protein [Ottowia sp.]HQO54218.1 YitT family protein [Ottowia sp.]HQQ54524.1 YitT family protein [Ottowia sp.]
MRSVQGWQGLRGWAARRARAAGRPSVPPRAHSALEDVQAILTGCLFVALALVFMRDSRLLPGGVTGLAFIVHYASGWALGAALFVLNLPFYLFAWRALGWRFTLKTFVAVAVLALYTELLPRLVGLARLDPVFSAVMSGLLAGTGILILMRHQASLGGLGALAFYLQQRRGWRAGTVQMLCDALILGSALWLLPPGRVALSVLSAAALNFVIAINHRPDRYHGI